MQDSLLLASVQPQRLVSFTIQGVHTELLGSGNQVWDRKVALAIGESLQLRETIVTEILWYVLHVRWLAWPPQGKRRKDLDNFRLKPILDHLTASKVFWPDDNINYVRAIYSEVDLIGSSEEQRVEVTVYGITAATDTETRTPDS